MPALLAATKTSPDGHARVITTSSSASYLDTLHFETFKDGPERRKMGSTHMYNQSKHVRSSQVFQPIDTMLKDVDPFQGNIMVAREVAKRYGKEGIISISVNPGELPITRVSATYSINVRGGAGNIQSDLQRHMPRVGRAILVCFLLRVAYGFIFLPPHRTLCY